MHSLFIVIEHNVWLQDLSHNNLTLLPPGMGYLVRLTEIDLSHNKLTELPPDIVNLRGEYCLNAFLFSIYVLKNIHYAHILFYVNYKC